MRTMRNDPFCTDGHRHKQNQQCYNYLITSHQLKTEVFDLIQNDYDISIMAQEKNKSQREKLYVFMTWKGSQYSYLLKSK